MFITNRTAAETTIQDAKQRHIKPAMQRIMARIQIWIRVFGLTFTKGLQSLLGPRRDNVLVCVPIEDRAKQIRRES
jgi:hypothetical protein